MTIRRHQVLLCLCLALITSHAHAQFAIHGTASLTNYNRNDLPRRSDSGGLAGGIFYNFPSQSRLKAGVDARASFSPGTRGGASGLGALRISFVPHQIRFRPYFEIGGGVVKANNVRFGLPSTSPTMTIGKTNGALALIFGLDVRLSDSWDLRAAELGAASGGNLDAGSGFLNIGVVYHLPHR